MTGQPPDEPDTSIDAIMASIRQIVTDAPAVRDAAAPLPPPVRVSPPMPVPPPPPAAAGSITVEALVRSMLAPVLRDWLDAHLPEIVEAATQAEIRRLTGRND